MDLLIILLLLAGSALGLWGFVNVLFRQGSRATGVLMIAGSVALLSYSGSSLDEEAKRLGFASYQEHSEASAAGITDAKEWTERRDDIRARRAAEEAERQRKALEAERESLAGEATAAGFDDVAAYQKARAAGITTKAAYNRYLLREAFFTPPPDQRGVVEAIAAARKAYRSAPNDLARGGIRAQRKHDMCRHLRRRRATDWAGTITELTTNSDGKGVISLSIGDDIHVKTWNNALSDLAHDTLIDPNSAVFKKLATMKIGARVKFSGRFFPANPDCVFEESLTLQGSMERPEFIVRFSRIRAP